MAPGFGEGGCSKLAALDVLSLRLAITRTLARTSTPTQIGIISNGQRHRANGVHLTAGRPTANFLVHGLSNPRASPRGELEDGD